MGTLEVLFYAGWEIRNLKIHITRGNIVLERTLGMYSVQQLEDLIEQQDQLVRKYRAALSRWRKKKGFHPEMVALMLVSMRLQVKIHSNLKRKYRKELNYRKKEDRRHYE